MIFKEKSELAGLKENIETAQQKRDEISQKNEKLQIRMAEMEDKLQGFESRVIQHEESFQIAIADFALEKISGGQLQAKRQLLEETRRSGPELEEMIRVLRLALSRNQREILESNENLATQNRFFWQAVSDQILDELPESTREIIQRGWIAISLTHIPHDYAGFLKQAAGQPQHITNNNVAYQAMRREFLPSE